MSEQSFENLNEQEICKFIENIKYVQNRKKLTHKYYDQRNIYLISNDDYTDLKTLFSDLFNKRYEIIAILKKYNDLININHIIEVLSDDCSFELLITKYENFYFYRHFDEFTLDTRLDPTELVFTSGEKKHARNLIPEIIITDKNKNKKLEKK